MKESEIIIRDSNSSLLEEKNQVIVKDVMENMLDVIELRNSDTSVSTLSNDTQLDVQYLHTRLSSFEKNRFVQRRNLMFRRRIKGRFLF